MEDIERFEIETLPQGLWQVVSCDCVDEIIDNGDDALVFDLILNDNKGNKALVSYVGQYVPQMIQRLKDMYGEVHTNKIFLPINYIVRFQYSPYSKTDIIGIDFKEYTDIFHFKDKFNKEYNGTEYAFFITYDKAIKFCIEVNKNIAKGCLATLDKYEKEIYSSF